MPPRRRAAKIEAKVEAPRTKYVVLRAVDVTSILAEIAASAPGLSTEAWVGLSTEAWVPVVGDDGAAPRVFEAAGPDAAIRMHTGSGADVVEGRWKAVAVSSWQGWVQTRRVTAEDRARGREELI